MQEQQKTEQEQEQEKLNNATQYIDKVASETAILFDKATEYREKLSNAKTPLSRSMYSKKLKKYVTKLEAHIKFFSKIDELNKAEEAALLKNEGGDNV